MGTVYDVKELTKIYPPGVLANDRISLKIEAGEIFGLFGPNGAGKTTLIRQLAGLLRPSRGTIRLFGYDIVKNPEIVPHHVGYYGQKVVALRAHKLCEVIYITGRLRGQSSTEAKKQTEELLEWFELDGLAHRLLFHLSGGEQRLATLLAAFMGYPPILILDEPTNELDPRRRRRVWEYLWELNDTRGTTILLATHNLLEAERVVKRVAIIDRGRIQALGTPGELKRRLQGTVRVEIHLRDGGDKRAEEVLADMHGGSCLRPGRWQITAPQSQASSLLMEVLERIDLETLDDFRLTTPTLEDIYMQVTGREWEGDGQRNKVHEA
jgi:ABC-type multidrug transport system ATPase subunit